MFEVTGGLRHERERRSIDHRMRLSSGGMPLKESGLERSASGGAWLPKVQFIVHWSPDMMTYVSAARGYWPATSSWSAPAAASSWPGAS